ncbi:MAG: hypothetical protein JWO76_1645 [Nocardioides sp.]|nr:hypothetical protein [Nocardioides sp.]
MLDVLAEAARIESALKDGDVWWASWQDWTPAGDPGREKHAAD